MEVEVQADTLHNSGKEATEIADSKLNVGAEESELQKEEGCLQCHENVPVFTKCIPTEEAPSALKTCTTDCSRVSVLFGV